MPNLPGATAASASSSSAMATAASSNSHSQTHQSHADLDGDDIRSRFPWFSGDTQSPFSPAAGADSSSHASASLSHQHPKAASADTHHRTYAATPLILAVLAGNVRAVAQLVSRFHREGTLDHDLEATDSLGRTPLIACIFGVDTLEITADNLPLVSQVHPTHGAIFDLLVSQVKDPTVFERGHACIHHISPFILASYLGKTQYVRRMLERGCHVDCTDTQNGTALMYAARDNHLGVVQVLLEYNASVDRTDDNGWSALDYGEKYDEVRELLEAAPHLPLSDEEEEEGVESEHGHVDEHDVRSFEARQRHRASSPSLETPPSTGITYPAHAPTGAPYVKQQSHAHFQPHFSESHTHHAPSPAVAPAAAPPSLAHPPPAPSAHHPSTSTSASSLSAAADARLDQMYHEYCKVADVANTLRASEAFWMDRWHELAMHVMSFVDAVASPMAQVAGIARVPLSSFMSGGEASVSVNEQVPVAGEEGQQQQPSSHVPPQLDALANALASKTAEVHQLASHVASLKSKRDPPAATAPASGLPQTPSSLVSAGAAVAELQSHAADLTMALADLMRIESQRRRLATAVAADHQRKIASKWRAEAVAAKQEAAKLRAAAAAAAADPPHGSGIGGREAEWKRVLVQIGSVAKAIGAPLPPPSPSSDAARPISPTPISTALDAISTRVHHLDAQLRQVREHNVRLLRELDSKDVSVRLLESQVNWLKVNHETVAHQQSQALALQAHTIHSLASGTGHGSVSVPGSSSQVPPRRPSTSTLTGAGGAAHMQMAEALRMAQWEDHGPSRAATATPAASASRHRHTRQSSADYAYHHHHHHGHREEEDDDDDHSLSLMTPPRTSAHRTHHYAAQDPHVRTPRSTSRHAHPAAPAASPWPASTSQGARRPSLPADIHRHPRRASSDAATAAAAHARHVSSEISLAGTSSVLVSDDEYSSSIATPIRDRQRSGLDSRYSSVRAAAAAGAVPQRANVPESLRSGRTGRGSEGVDRDLGKEKEKEKEERKWGWTQSFARKVKKMRSTSDLRR